MKTDPWQIVRDFEEAVADFAGAPHAVAVDTCSWALFLCLKWFRAPVVYLPNRTYLGVACQAHHAGCCVMFDNREWKGEYTLDPWPIVDSACRFKEGMYRAGEYRCVSFQTRKHLPIGRGGMILCDNPEACAWLRRARFLGRPECPQEVEGPAFIGWHAFMDPARAADGLARLAVMPDRNPPDLEFIYPDITQYKCFSC